MPLTNPRARKFDRCVEKVAASGSAQNPYAVCTASLGYGRTGNPSDAVRRLGAFSKIRKRGQ